MHLCKKITALLLSLTLLAGLISGCGGSKSPKSPDNNQQQTTDKVPEYLNATGMPIVKQPITLKIMGSLHPNHAPWDQMYVLKEMEKRSGIHIEWDTPNNASYMEKLNLTLASNQLPDAFYRGRILEQDVVNYGSQGSFISLNKLIETYAPNLNKVFAAFPDAKPTLTAPDGNIYTVPQITGDYSSRVNWFLWLNQRWLNKVGMKLPTTTEEFYQVLKAFKDKDGNGNGKPDEIPLGTYKGRSVARILRGSFGLGSTSQDFELDKNGKVFFNKIDPRYKDLLQYMNRLYTEGLLDKEAFTKAETKIIADIGQDIVGCFYNNNPDSVGLTGEKADQFVGLAPLKGPSGDVVYSDGVTTVTGIGSFAITNVNKYPEATLRWVDYWFGDEGNEFLHGGEKGKTYNLAPDGSIVFTDLVTKDPNGINSAAGQFTPWAGGGIPRLIVKKYDPSPKNAPNAEAVRQKAIPYLKEAWPVFLYSNEEHLIMTSIGNDITKYANEMEIKFVTGSEPFASWDTYVNQVKKIGLDQVLKVQQAAYERYKNVK